MKTAPLIGLTVLLLAAFLGGCTSSPQAQRDKHLAKGKALVEKQDYSRALLEFKNALQAMPNEAETYYQMGLAAIPAKDLRTAALSFRKAVALDPKHTGAQLKLAQMMASSDDQELLKDAQIRLRTLLDGGSATSELLNTLAFAELRLGKPESAIDSLERALAQSPGDRAASVLMARAKLEQKDLKGAEEILKKACAETKSSDSHLVLAEFYLAQRRMPDAEAEFRRALELDPKNGTARLGLGRLQLVAGRKEEAEQSFKQLTVLDAYKFVYARFLYGQGRREEAVREFERVARNNPDDRNARTNLVASYVGINRLKEANDVLEAALKNNSKDGDALLQRAELLIASGNYGDAERDLNQVRRLKPNSPETHYVLAKLHKARNATLSYRQELTETLRLNPTLGAVRVELTENLTNNNEPRAALDVINAAPESQRKAVPLVVQRNWANWALGNLTEMRKGIDQGLALKRSVDLLIQDGMWQLRAGRFGASRVSLEEALKVNPADVRALRILYESYKVENKESLGIEKVKEYAAKQTQSAPMQHFLGTTLMVKRDREGARKAFLAAKLADPQFVKGDLSLVQLDMLERKHQDARKKLETIIAADSGNTTARLWLANVQLLTKDHGASIQNFQKVVDENPRNADALNNLAFVLAEHGNRLDEALKYAEKAVEIAPEQPVYCDTLGWVLYRKGIYSSAVKYLERADKGNVVSKYHLAMAYAKAGDVRRGRSTLDAALKIDSLIAEAKTAQQVVSEVSPSGQAESQRQRFSHSPQF